MADGTYRVEKGVDLPPGRPSAKYPFWDMVVGDSFLVACKEAEQGIKRGTVGSAAASFSRKQKGVKFAVRRVPEGVRCWRIK